MADRVWIRTRPNGDHEVYQVRWRERIDGVLHQKSKTFATFADAKAFQVVVQRRLHVVASAGGLMADLVKPKGDLLLLLEQFIGEVRLGLSEGARSPDHLRTIIRRMIDHFAWKTTGDITHGALLNVIKFFHGKDTIKHATIGGIKRFARWYGESNWVDERIATVKVKKPRSAERVFWTQDQVRTILRALAEPASDTSPEPTERSSAEWKQKIALTRIHKSYRAMAPLFRLLVLWALRPIEASRLVVGNWHPESRRLSISSKVAKNGFGRSIFVDGVTADMLATQCDGKSREDLIFRTSNGQPWSTGHMSHSFLDVFRSLDIPGSLYCTRHYACTRLLRRAGLKHVRTIMQITGHRTLTEFMKYLHVCDEDLRELSNSSYAEFLDDIQLPNAKPIVMRQSEQRAQPEGIEIIAEDDETCGGVAATA